MPVIAIYLWEPIDPRTWPHTIAVKDVASKLFAAINVEWCISGEKWLFSNALNPITTSAEFKYRP